jgi:type I restriction-modification system DNA methylase subunit
MTREQIHLKLKSLVQKFEANKYYYLSKKYLEEEVKNDFISPLFEALGWDVGNTKALSPYEREVLVEKGETVGRPDYNFRIDGQTKFFLEAKPPHEQLHRINHVLQAKSYAWNTKSVFIVVLTDFEEFRLFDATIKPDPKNPDQGLIFELTYDKYLDNIDKLMLLSREEVEKGSLDKLILKDPRSKKLRIPVDRAFLEDLSAWREELAKDIYKRNIKDLEDRSDEKRVKIQVKILNEAVQKILDRLIFIRIAEDRKIIEPKSLLEEVEWWKAGGKRRDLQRRLIDRFMGWNQDFNGEILKPGPCDILEIDSHLLAQIIEGLYFPKCPYLFDVIGVELLGSIYERYLGKTIRVTPKRVKIEEKPEVRKAGGVYYTPQYIVDYIVKNTVGKIIKGKTPQQIEKITILDPACGSGSFLLAAFQTLIDYYIDYYEKHPEEAGFGTLFPDVITDYFGTKRLSIEKKVQILRNNIFGVDIDPQAVEIAMMSLYLKCLEGEKDLPKKKELLPSLAKNIRCGNSLISYDIFDQLTLFEDEEKERINPFDWYSKSTGFGEIMDQGGFDVVIGNPPYVRQEMLGDFKSYFQNCYKVYHGVADLYVYFIEKGISLIKLKGLFGIIVSNKWIRTNYGEPLRSWLKAQRILRIVDFGDLPVFQDVTTYPCILIMSKLSPGKNFPVIKVSTLKFLSLDNYVKDNQYLVNQKSLENTAWSLTDERTHRLLQKIKSKGIPLSKYVGNKIYRGILTGLNKAFVIDEKTKKRLIKEDLNSAEIIKPFLLGRDIKRYAPAKSNKYLIFARHGINIDKYPAIKKFLSQFKEELMPRPKDWQGVQWKGRKPGKYMWYEIQDTIAYFKEFEKPKIIWGNLCIESPFTLDKNGYYINAPSCFIPLGDTYLLGLVNSSLLWLFLKNIAIGRSGGFIEAKPIYVKQLPIYVIDFSKQRERAIHNQITKLVYSIIELNKKKIALLPSSEQDRIEREIKITDEKIDKLVYELYGITKEEKKIIEREI